MINLPIDGWQSQATFAFFHILKENGLVLPG